MPLMPLSHHWLKIARADLVTTDRSDFELCSSCAIADSSSFCQTREIFDSIIRQPAISLASTLPDAFEDYFLPIGLWISLLLEHIDFSLLKKIKLDSINDRAH